MARFTLYIDLVNEAMDNYEDVCNALIDVARRIRKNGYFFTSDISRKVLDENGNTVGYWAVEVED
jgi:hypothetical protein